MPGMADTTDSTTSVGGTVSGRAPEFHDRFPLVGLHPDPENHRKGGLGDLTSLAEDIRARGVSSPLMATPHPRAPAGTLLLVYGHRRREAALIAGREHVRVIVVYGENPAGGLSDDEIDRERANENLERADLTPTEEGWIYEGRARRTGDSDARVAAFYGKSQGQVTKRRALLRLPEAVQQAVDKGGKEGGIGSGDGYVLSQLMTHPEGEAAVVAIVDGFLDGTLGVSIQQAAADEKRRLGIESKTVGRRGNQPAAGERPRPGPGAEASGPALRPGGPPPNGPVPDPPLTSRQRRRLPAYDQRDQVLLRLHVTGEVYRLIVDHRIHGGRGRPGFVHWLTRFAEEEVRRAVANLPPTEAIPTE